MAHPGPPACVGGLSPWQAGILMRPREARPRPPSTCGFRTTGHQGQDGASRSNTSALQSNTSTFQANTGAFPANTGALQPSTGAFQSTTGAFQSKTGAFRRRLEARRRIDAVVSHHDILPTLAPLVNATAGGAPKHVSAVYWECCGSKLAHKNRRIVCLTPRPPRPLPNTRKSCFCDCESERQKVRTKRQN